MVYSPSTEVSVPEEKPVDLFVMTTVAPGTGSLFSSTTCPVTVANVLACPHSCVVHTTSNKTKEIKKFFIKNSLVNKSRAKVSSDY